MPQVIYMLPSSRFCCQFVTDDKLDGMVLRLPESQF